MGRRLDFNRPRGTLKSAGAMDAGVRTHSRGGGKRGRWAGWWTLERDAKLVYVMEKYGDIYKAARVLGVRTCMVVKRIKVLQHTGQMERRYYGDPLRGPVDFYGDGGVLLKGKGSDGA